MMKILVVDDHAIVRRGIKQVLRDHFGDDPIFHGAESGAEAMQKLQIDTYDLVLLDISLRDMSGLDLLQRFKQEKNRTPVLMLTMHSEEQYAFHSLKAGADGYITKICTPDELITAVTKLLSGGKYISPVFSEALISRVTNENSRSLSHAILSDREFKVFRDIASGSSTKEIADQLCLSIKTVSTYRARIMQKMKMKSNADIINYAIRNGLVE